VVRYSPIAGHARCAPRRLTAAAANPCRRFHYVSKGITVADQQSRALQSRLAAHTSWANTTDRSARTEPARTAALGRFERQVDPDGTLPPAERERRAEHAKKAYFLDLALKSKKAREARKSAATAAELHALVDEITGGES
jgi:hypothetical protein